MDQLTEILVRVKRIEQALGLPPDLPAGCDRTGCTDAVTFTQTVGWPVTSTVRRCAKHTPGMEPE